LASSEKAQKLACRQSFAQFTMLNTRQQQRWRPHGDSNPRRQLDLATHHRRHRLRPAVARGDGGLFHFLAERYEKKTVVITSNLVFSQWDQIFKNPMTTMAAIDRLVHHATILEFTGESIRANAAKKRHG
jgi:hypothetical protein